MRWLPPLLFALYLLPVHAAIEALQFETPEAEQTYKKMIHELRCLVCQNQNLADSDADLAKDLRHQTYEMVQSGKNEQQIIDYMVERYGEFVLYRPRLRGFTALLWIGPFVLLGAVLIGVLVKQRSKIQTSTPAAPESLEQARSILRDSSEKSS